MRMKSFLVWAIALVAVLILALFMGGVFASDRGVFLEPTGLQLDVNNATPWGHVFRVRLERRLGHDRTLFISEDATEAATFMTLWVEVQR